jgi:hypothetical protein
MLLEPVASESGDFLKGARFFKKMGSARHDFQMLLTPQGMTALIIQFDHHRVLGANDL